MVEAWACPEKRPRKAQTRDRSSQRTDLGRERAPPFPERKRRYGRICPPKRPAHARQAFPDTASMPDIDLGEENMTDAGLDMETESAEFETTSAEETESGHPKRMKIKPKKKRKKKILSATATDGAAA